MWRGPARTLPPLLHSKGAGTAKLLRGSRKEPLFQAQGQSGAQTKIQSPPGFTAARAADLRPEQGSRKMQEME